MKNTNFWLRAKNICIQVPEDIGSGFDMGFDANIPVETQNELRSFVKWVELNFNLPVPLWVDFEYKHYLRKRDGKRAGYLFYWADFSSYPVFANPKEIPQIRLPVRTERSTMIEVLTSFIEAITDYFAWLCNEICEDYKHDETDMEDILQAYLNSRV